MSRFWSRWRRQSFYANAIYCPCAAVCSFVCALLVTGFAFAFLSLVCTFFGRDWQTGSHEHKANIVTSYVWQWRTAEPGEQCPVKSLVHKRAGFASARVHCPLVWTDLKFLQHVLYAQTPP